MNKTLITIVTVALMLLTSARYTTPSDGRVGYQAPNLSLSNTATSVQLQDFRGQYVVVTFWSSAQPASRIANAKLSTATANNSEVAYIAVNMDRSRGLFEQLIAVDNLDGKAQFHIDLDSQEQVMQSWRQNGGDFSSFLIDPQGKILKQNPTPADIALL